MSYEHFNFQSLVSSTWVSFYWLPKRFQRYKINFSFQISHLHFAYSAALLQDLGIIKDYSIPFYITTRVKVFRKQDYCIYIILSYPFLSIPTPNPSFCTFSFNFGAGNLQTIFLLCYLTLIPLIPTIFFFWWNTQCAFCFPNWGWYLSNIHFSHCPFQGL